jgi:hypothetical protein
MRSLTIASGRKLTVPREALHLTDIHLIASDSLPLAKDSSRVTPFLSKKRNRMDFHANQFLLLDCSSPDPFHNGCIDPDSIDGVPIWKCMLCSLSFENHGESARTHLQSELHERRMRDVACLKREAAIQWKHKIHPLESRIEQLGSDDQKDKIYGKLYRAIFKNNYDDKTDYLQQAKDALLKYEVIEGVCLLELAIWKAICILHPSEPSTDYYFWKKWMERGWKINKRTMRRSRDISIVMENVLPFISLKFDDDGNPFKA